MGSATEGGRPVIPTWIVGVLVCLVASACADHRSDRPPLASIALGVSELTVPSGASRQLTLTGTTVAGSVTPITSGVTWASSEPAVARISEEGVVTGVAVGTTVISAVVTGLMTSATVHVGPAELLSVSVVPGDAAVVLGDHQVFTAVAIYTDGPREVTSEATWSAIDGLVRFDGPGDARPEQFGSARIQASFQALSATASLQATDGFDIVLLPDTQLEVEESGGGNLEMLLSEMRWIVDSRHARNIRAVVSLGDIANCAKLDYEWQNADRAYRLLDDAGMIYVPTIGNHDYDHATCGKVGGRSTSRYNATFGPDRLGLYSWYGASSFPSGSNENFYVTFEVGSFKYLVLALEFAPREEALLWAEQVIQQHADRLVIVVTHAYLVSNEARRSILGDLGGPAPGFFEFTEPANGGEDVWQKLLRDKPNVILVAGGHWGGKPTHRTDVGDAGNVVAEMCVDFQSDGHGGSGRVRTLHVRPVAESIDATSYSPYYGDELTDDANQFTIPFHGVVASSGALRAAASIDTEAVSFPAVPPNTTSAPSVVTLSNGGAAPLYVSGVSLTGANAADFSMSSACGTHLEVGTSCEITVTSRPTSVGATFATLVIASDDPLHPTFAVTLQGHGLAASGVTLTASLPSPQPVGTAVAFTASGQGSAGYQYEFWVRNGAVVGSPYVKVQDYGEKDVWILPATLAAGTYSVLVYVRTTATGSYEAAGSMSFTIRLPAATGVTITADLPSPQVAGTAVTFTAAGEGSSAYQYKFWMKSLDLAGSAYQAMRDYDVASSWTMPASTAAGRYSILVYVRANVSGGYEAASSVVFTLTQAQTGP